MQTAQVCCWESRLHRRVRAQLNQLLALTLGMLIATWLARMTDRLCRHPFGLQITIGLLQKAMAESGKQCVLIDGFPRNADNRDTWLQMVSLQ